LSAMDGYQFDKSFATGRLITSQGEFPGFSTPPLNFSSPRIIAGVDEAGRGPLAGPVVAAAVVLPWEPEIEGLNDSKLLSSFEREALYCEIQETALTFSVSIIDPPIIDSLNILGATLHAMREAVRNLDLPPDLVLVDGNQRPGSGVEERAIIKGDGKSAAIMAASIMAKVTRDNIMADAHKVYPQYGFNLHKGYGSGLHLKALKEFGPCPLHRKSFEPVRSVMAKEAESQLSHSILKS